MLNVEQALETMLKNCHGTEIEEIALSKSLDHTLADAVISTVNLPPFDNSAVDGFAVFAADIALACESTPVTLRLAFQQSAGPTQRVCLERGTTARVMTGAPTPQGADAVVMQEDAIIPGNDSVTFTSDAHPGEHIRRVGSDLTAGDAPISAGTLLGPAEVAILAAMGQSMVRVHRKPRVAILTTGDEVEDVENGEALLFGKIYNSNRYCLDGLVRRAGCDVSLLLHVPDDFEATCAALTAAVGSGVDAVVCAGGVSVGARDFVKPAIETLGTLDMWRVAMKPGKPVAFGKVGSTPFFGLPGNPASVLVTFELFVRPCLCKIAGKSVFSRPIVTSILADPIVHEIGRREFVRASTVWMNGGYTSTTTGSQGSGRLRSLLGFNSLIVVSEDRSSVNAGEEISVMLTGD